MSERLIVALDGATRTCSTALLGGESRGEDRRPEVLARRSEENSRGQGRILLSQVHDMLSEIGAERRDLSRVVVGVGPGTFTGVRIAVATARGLALALGVPVHGRTSLRALAAYALDGEGGRAAADNAAVVPVIDARRGQVFFTVYKNKTVVHDEHLPTWEQVGAIEACDIGAFEREALDGLEGSPVVVGDVPELMTHLRRDHILSCSMKAEYLVLGDRAIVSDSHVSDGVSAPSGIAGDMEGTPETVRPIYVRAPDADVHIQKMKDPWADAKNES